MTGACEEIAASIRTRLAEIGEEAARLREALAILSDAHPPRTPARPRPRRRSARPRRPGHPAPAEPPPVTAATPAQLDEPHETGALDPARRREPVRQVARCHKCGEEREGVTRFESMSFGHHPAGRPIHFCDECRDAIVERPLEEVLFDLIGDGPLEQTAGLCR